jgi:hypothetical protein
VTARRSLLLLALVAAAVCTYVCVVIRYVGRPLRFDETEWPVQVAGILRHGVPKVLYTEDKMLWLHPLLGYKDAHYGMWHPPFYQYSLALVALACGLSDTVVRGTSLLWLAASLLLAWQILRLVLPRDTPALLRAVPLALVLLTPLLSEGSLHPDIDNTSLMFFLLLLALVFLRDPLNVSWRRCLSLGLLFALALWSKLTSPFLLLGAAALYLFLNRRWRSGLALAIAVPVLGFGLFLATYFLYCKLLGYPPDFMFEHSYLHNRKIYQPNNLWPIVQSMRWHTLWLSPGILLLLLWSFGTRVREYLRDRRTEAADFLLLASGAIFFFYVAWGGVFGKYTVPGAMLGLLGAAPQIAAALRDVRIERPRAYLALWLALLAAALLLPALQVRPGSAAVSSRPWLESILDARNLVLLFAVAALALFYALSRRLLSAPSAGRIVVFALVIYIAVANPVNALKVVLPDYDRSPYRPFFDRGFQATVATLNAEYGDGTVIIGPKDIGYYFRGRCYPLETVAGFPGLAALRPLIESREAAAVVENLKYPTLTDPALLQLLDRLAVRTERGDYVIWHLRPADDPPPPPAVPSPLAR